jgi:hypothetical protein
VTYQVGQLTYSVFPPVADPGTLGTNELNHIESYPAAETIQPGRAVMITSGALVQQAQGTRGDTTTNLDIFAWSVLKTAREGLGQENDSATTGGAAYNAGDMVACLRSGCIFAEWKGTTIPTTGLFNVYQSSTLAADRGKLTDAAAATTVGSEIGPVGGRVRARPMLPALTNSGNIVLIDLKFPGSAA